MRKEPMEYEKFPVKNKESSGIYLGRRKRCVQGGLGSER